MAEPKATTEGPPGSAGTTPGSGRELRGGPRTEGPSALLREVTFGLRPARPSPESWDEGRGHLRGSRFLRKWPRGGGGRGGQRPHPERGETGAGAAAPVTLTRPASPLWAPGAAVPREGGRLEASPSTWRVGVGAAPARRARARPPRLFWRSCALARPARPLPPGSRRPRTRGRQEPAPRATLASGASCSSHGTPPRTHRE